jgi:prepilin-type N-terminal cleavage/methylation domain-containing protein
MSDYKYQCKQKAGFTLVEILVVITIIVIIAAVSMVGFRNYASFQQFNQAASDVQFVIAKAQQQARSAEGDTSHGIKFTPTSTTAFRGVAFVFSHPQNVLFEHRLVTLQYDLTGGTDVLVFSRLTGLPSATGTVTVVGTRYAATTTIEITATGVIQ